MAQGYSEVGGPGVQDQEQWVVLAHLPVHLGLQSDDLSCDEWVLGRLGEDLVVLPGLAAHHLEEGVEVDVLRPAPAGGVDLPHQNPSLLPGHLHLESQQGSRNLSMMIKSP